MKVLSLFSYVESNSTAICSCIRIYASKAPGVSLNVHLTVPPTTTAAQDGSHTPNTPEILNSIVKLQAEREEAREALASSGPFGAEFARQCAIRSTPIPAMSLPNELSTEEAVPVKPISSGYNQIEVITKKCLHILIKIYLSYKHLVLAKCCSFFLNQFYSHRQSMSYLQCPALLDLL